MNKNFSPKISVIIPVYNAEKYLPVCLESLAAQTMQDFEVIIVDDCSTDSSVAIAENFLERFGGRLKIFSLPQNTGSGAIPRNEGLKFSRGEYVLFMDNDDLLVKDALAELYDAAKNFRADVVFMEHGYTCGEEIFPTVFTTANWSNSDEPIEAPTLETFDIAERVKKFLQAGYGWAPWTKFLRRDFLIANEINFPHVKISEDVPWTFKIICLAEKFLRVPNRLYVCRTVENSLSRAKRSPQEEIIFWLNPLLNGLDYLDEFISRIKFFEQNPKYRFEVTNFFVKMQLAGMLDAMDKLYLNELYEIFYREFSKGDGRHAALIANLLVFMNYYRNKI